jgi:hypothetical protein
VNDDRVTITLRQLESQESEPWTAASDPFTRTAETKAARQRALLASVHGRRVPQQPHGERPPRLGFDGGARQPSRARRSSHDQWLGGVLKYGSADLDAHF